MEKRKFRGFIPSTLVSTPHGPMRIDELQPGMEVIGFNPETLSRRPQKILKVHKTYVPYYLTEFGCAPHQEVWQSGKFVEAWRLDERDTRLGRFELLELTVEPDHTFELSTGLRVHNRFGTPQQTQQVNTNQNFTNWNNSSRTPWAPAQQYYLDFLKSAAEGFGIGGAGGSGGDTWMPFKSIKGKLYAGPDVAQRQAYRRMVDLAPSTDAGYQETRQLGLDMLNGKYMMAESNPYLQSAIAAAQRPMQDQYNREIMPQITSQAVQKGAYGGSRNAVAQAIASHDLTNAMGDVASTMSNENYARERMLQMQAPGLLQQAVGLQMNPANILMQAGTWKQGEHQKRIDARLQKQLLNREGQMMNQQSMMNRFGAFGNILNSLAPFGDTTSSGGGTMTEEGIRKMFGNPYASGLQGALGGASLGSLLGGPWSWLGGIAGGIGGLFGG